MAKTLFVIFLPPVLSGHMPSIPAWFVVMMLLIFHSLITGIASLPAWVIAGKANQIPLLDVSYGIVFLTALPAGALPLLLRMSGDEQIAGTILYIYPVALLGGLTAGAIIAGRRANEKRRKKQLHDVSH